MDIIITFALLERGVRGGGGKHKTQKCLFYIEELQPGSLVHVQLCCVGAPRGRHWEVRQCGCNLIS